MVSGPKCAKMGPSGPKVMPNGASVPKWALGV